MKKNFQILMVLAAMFYCGQVWAGGGGTSSKKYQYKVMASTANSGMGLIYINKNQGTPTLSQYGASQSPHSGYKTSSSETEYIYAKPAHGYKFKNWTSQNGSAGVGTGTITFKSSTSAETTTTMTPGSYTPDDDNDIRYWFAYAVANFEEDKSTYTITLQRPKAGSISVQSTIYSIINNSFSKSFDTIISNPTDATETVQLTYNPADDITLIAEDGDGANFFAWYVIENGVKTKISNAGKTYQLESTYKNKNITICAEFSLANFLVGSTGYETIEEAITAAQNGSDKTIVLLQDIALTGEITIPTGVTLLVPNNSYNKLYTDNPESGYMYKIIPEDKCTESQYIDRSFVYRKLTLSENAKLTVNGSISLGGWRWCTRYYGGYGANVPDLSGSYRLDQGYGMIDMAANSSIILEDGSHLYCWGRIRGEGKIVAKSGSTVRESWVYTDMRESDAYQCIYNNTRVFPMNQYYIQDIQVPITFNFGATEELVTGMVVESGGGNYTAPYTGLITWIGSSDKSFFRLSTNDSITKHYDVASDRQVYDLYNGVDIEKALLTVSGYNQTFSTAEALFNLTNNCTVNIKSGTTTLKNNLALAAGAELNIEAGAEFIVAEHASLYVFDKDDWNRFACKRKIVPLFLPSYELKEAKAYESVTTTFSGYYTTYKAIRTEDNITDAVVKVDGTLTIKGKSNNLFSSNSGLYTTESGATISSTASGMIVYEQGVGAETTVDQLWRAGREDANKCVAKQDTSITITPAKLYNADGSYYPTAAYTSNTTFKYVGTGVDGKWGKVSTVKFMDGETLLSSVDYAEGETITAPTPEKEGYTFKGWGNDFTDIMGQSDVTYSAQWQKNIVVTTMDIVTDSIVDNNITADVVNITDGAKLELNAEAVITIKDTLTIELGATLDLGNDQPAHVNTIALSSTPAALDIENGQAGVSSQVLGNGALEYENVFIDIAMDPSGQLNGSIYYAFAVPFNVNIDGGVQKVDSKGKVSPAVSDTDYRAYIYDGANRATNGKGNNWKQVKEGDFESGVFYLVEFADGSCNTFRFTKATGQNLNNENQDIHVIGHGDKNPANPNNGWNGIANNALHDAKIALSNGGNAQVYDPVGKVFTPVSLSNTKFSIGMPLMVQVLNDGNATHPSAAPARQLAAQEEDNTFGNYTIRIKAEGAAKMADQLFISASETASTEYVIGKDMVKMFMGNATIAQLWVNDYDKKLAMNQTVLTNDMATASLTLYAPKAGSYSVYLKDIPTDATIYLMQNGQSVACLNDGACTVELTKGENTSYGIRIHAHKSPQVTTSMDEIVNSEEVQKVLLNGVVYIVRDGKMYNALGIER